MAPTSHEGRDVTTTELTATTAAERNALTHLAADARMLASHPNPNVVPVLEARWLAANRLAITRADVPASTLRQALERSGPMSESHVAEVLNEIGGVLDWAARANVVHRHVTSDSVYLQEKPRRVMVSFGLPAGTPGAPGGGDDDTVFLFDRCVDGATLARLAYEMLTAGLADDASVESLKAMRPEVSAEMLAAVEAGLNCPAGARPMTAGQFLALLPGGKAPRVDSAAIATAASAPVVPRDATTPVRAPAIPLAAPRVDTPDIVAVSAAPMAGVTPVPPAATPVVASPPVSPTGDAAPRRRRGRGLLVASMLALVLLIGATFALIQRGQSGADDTRVATTQRDDESAGDVDVAQTELPPDSTGLTAGETTTGEADASLPSSLPSNLPRPLPRSLPRAGQAEPQPQPPAREAPVERPQPHPQRQTGAVASAGTPTAGASSATRSRRAAVGVSGCASPAMADQRACLSGLIALSDRELTSIYQALLREVNERNGPEAVENIRVKQRAWLVTRDRACKSPAAQDGALWAQERAACLARQSDARALELARALAAIRSRGN